MKRAIASLPLIGLIALGVLFAAFGLHHDPRVAPAALVGRPAPRLMLARLGGGPPAPFPTGRGAPLLVNFFASWCGPCVAEAAELDALKARGVRIAGVAYEDDPVETLAFLRRVGDPFETVSLDPTGRGGIDYGVSGVPETFLIDRDGRIVAKHAGALTASDAAKLLGHLAAGARLAN